MFSGGSYDEVKRWLRNFLISHAKREHPRVEVVLDYDDALEGRAYRARLRLGDRVSEPLELDYKEVAERRRRPRPLARARPAGSRRGTSTASSASPSTTPPTSSSSPAC